jgi:anaphase-promoting complex subunit 10
MTAEVFDAADETGDDIPEEEVDGDEESDEEGEEEEEATAEEVDAEAAESSPTNDSGDRVIKSVPNLDSLYGLREVGREALCWQLSSAKPGNGVEQLLDPCFETYWQSDGSAQPHWIQLHFGRRLAISHVCLYVDYQLDESYTPRKVIVEIGLTQQDLIPACAPVELVDPNGWCIIPLQAPPDPLDDPTQLLHPSSESSGSQQHYVKTHLLRISVLAMHQNGRDTHVRHVQLYGPRMKATVLGGSANFAAWEMSPANDRNSTLNSGGGRSNRDDGLLTRPGGDFGDGFGMLQTFSSIR